MTPGIRIERRNADEPMHTRFGFEPTIGIVAVDLQYSRLDASFLTGMLVENFDLVAVLLGPTHIHAKEHPRPVLALGTPCPCIHLEKGVVAVRLAAKQRLDLVLA